MPTETNLLILRKHLWLSFVFCILVAGCSSLSGAVDTMPPPPTAEPNGGISISAEQNRLRLTVTKVENLDDRLRFFLVATNGSPDSKDLPLDKVVVRDSSGKLYAADPLNSYWLGTVPGKFSVTGYITLIDPLENRSGAIDLGFTNVDLFVQRVPVQDVAPPLFQLDLYSETKDIIVTKVEVLGDSLYRFWIKVDYGGLCGKFKAENFFARNRDGRQYPVTKYDWPTNPSGPLAGYFTVGPLGRDVEFMMIGFATTPEEFECGLRMGREDDMVDWVPLPRVGVDGQLVVPVAPTPTATQP